MGDYSKQACAYDSTRSASPSVLGPLREALAGASGRELLDIGGGTGNYAQALAAEGWQPLVIDRSPQMLSQAEAKGLSTKHADATKLPFSDESFDAVMLIAMIHHVDKPELALAEARRVLRPGGRLALMAFTREDIDDSWCIDYFSASRPWMYETHLRLRELLAELPGARRIPVTYRDLQDGSMAALLGHPERLLEAERRSQTSFFERMERDHPDDLRAGLERLEHELSEARAPRRSGGASMLAWVKNATAQLRRPVQLSEARKRREDQASQERSERSVLRTRASGDTDRSTTRCARRSASVGRVAYQR